MIFISFYSIGYLGPYAAPLCCCVLAVGIICCMVRVLRRGRKMLWHSEGRNVIIDPWGRLVGLVQMQYSDLCSIKIFAVVIPALHSLLVNNLNKMQPLAKIWVFLTQNISHCLRSTKFSANWDFAILFLNTNIWQFVLQILHLQWFTQMVRIV